MTISLFFSLILLTFSSAFSSETSLTTVRMEQDDAPPALKPLGVDTTTVRTVGEATPLEPAQPKPKERFEINGQTFLRSIKLTALERSTLEKGELVIRDDSYLDSKGMPVGKVKAYTIIKGSLDYLAKTIGDPTDQPEFMPRLTEVTLLKNEGARKLYHFKLKIMVVSIEYFLYITKHEQADDFALFTWHLDQTKENDIKESIGGWAFRPYKQGETLVEYSLYVDTGRFIPEFAQKFLMKQDLPDVLGNLKKRIESGGKWKK